MYPRENLYICYDKFLQMMRYILRVYKISWFFFTLYVWAYKYFLICNQKVFVYISTDNYLRSPYRKLVILKNDQLKTIKKKKNLCLKIIQHFKTTNHTSIRPKQQKYYSTVPLSIGIALTRNSARFSSPRHRSKNSTKRLIYVLFMIYIYI